MADKHYFTTCHVLGSYTQCHAPNCSLSASNRRIIGWNYSSIDWHLITNLTCAFDCSVEFVRHRMTSLGTSSVSLLVPLFSGRPILFCDLPMACLRDAGTE